MLASTLSIASLVIAFFPTVIQAGVYSITASLVVVSLQRSTNI